MAWTDEELNRKIERVLRQCNSDGDEAMTFMAIYSFLEGYMKNNCGTRAEWFVSNKLSGDWTRFKFHNAVDSFILYERNDIKNKYFPHIKNLLELMKVYHGGLNNNLTTTNEIRHEFAELSVKKLAVVILHFIRFAEYQAYKEPFKIHSDRIKELLKQNKFFNVWMNKKVVEKSSLTDSSIHYLEKILSDKDNNQRLDDDNDINELKEEIKNLKEHNEDYTEKETELYYLKIKKSENVNPIQNELSEYITHLSEILIEVSEQKNYESQLMKMSDNQKTIVENCVKDLTSSEGKSMLIKGGPGTGKTLVLINILISFMLSGKTVQLLTYYKSLNKYIQYLFSIYNNANLYQTSNKTTLNLDEQTLDILRASKLRAFDDYMFESIERILNKKHFRMSDDEHIQRAKSHFLEKFPDNNEYANKLFSLAYDTIWPDLLLEKDFVTNDNKKKMWDDIQIIQSLIEKDDEYVDRFSYYKFCTMEIKPILWGQLQKPNYILIDEAQDLTNAQLSAARKLAIDGCVCAGDMNQSIRNKEVSWKKLGIDIVGANGKYTRSLTENFRSSFQIQELGKKYKECCKTKEENPLTASFEGPDSQLICSDSGSILSNVAKSIEFCRDRLNLSLGKICVVAFNSTELDELKCILSNKYDIKSNRISSNDYSFDINSDVVRLSTVKNIKGIDCPVLLFVADSRYVSEEKSGINEENLANSIYTCITRAMYFLQVFVTEESKSNSAIKELVDLMESKDGDSSAAGNKSVNAGKNFSDHMPHEMTGRQSEDARKSGYVLIKRNKSNIPQPENVEPKKAKVVIKRKVSSVLSVQDASKSTSTQRKVIVVNHNPSQSSKQ